jgi:ubiquinone/menaquinone biosynthesis C-methylase UbiE
MPVERPTHSSGTIEEEWRARFSRFAVQNDADHLVSGWSEQGLHRRHALFTELIAEGQLKPSAAILDLGCGAGTYVRSLTNLGYRAVGLDYSLPSLQRAVIADQAMAGRYVAAEAYQLPFSAESFDMVISMGVLQVLASPEVALKEMVRVLRPGGLLLIEFLNKHELASRVLKLVRPDPTGVRSYSLFQIRQWLTRQGLKQIQQIGVYLPPRNASWLGTVLDSRWCHTLLDRIPGASLLGAHAFMVCGAKGLSVCQSGTQ